MLQTLSNLVKQLIGYGIFEDQATLKNKTNSKWFSNYVFHMERLNIQTWKLWIENYQTKTLWYAQLCSSSKSPMVAGKKSDLLTMKCFLLKRKNKRDFL